MAKTKRTGKRARRNDGKRLEPISPPIPNNFNKSDTARSAIAVCAHIIDNTHSPDTGINPSMSPAFLQPAIMSNGVDPTGSSVFSQPESTVALIIPAEPAEFTNYLINVRQTKSKLSRLTAARRDFYVAVVNNPKLRCAANKSPAEKARHRDWKFMALKRFVIVNGNLHAKARGPIEHRRVIVDEEVWDAIIRKHLEMGHACARETWSALWSVHDISLVDAHKAINLCDTCNNQMNPLPEKAQKKVILSGVNGDTEVQQNETNHNLDLSLTKVYVHAAIKNSQDCTNFESRIPGLWMTTLRIRKVVKVTSRP